MSADRVTAELECEVLGAMLLDPAVIAPVAEILAFADFDSPRHALIFGRLVAMKRSGAEIGLVALKDELERHGELDQVGDAGTLAGIADAASTGVTAPENAERVRRRALERRLRKAAASVAQDVTDAEARRDLRRACDDLEAVIPRQSELEKLLERLRPLTTEEIGADQVPECIVEGWLYRGMLTLLVGGSKGGKSLLAAQAAVCVTAGIPFLDLKVRRGRVLYLLGEMSAAIMRDRIERIAETLGVPVPSFDCDLLLIAPTTGAGFPQLCLGDPLGREVVRRLIERHQPVLVIVDTLFGFLPGVDPMEPIVGEVLAALARIGREMACAVTVIDHSTKGVTSGEVAATPATAAYGSVFKGASAAVASHLKRQGNAWTLAAEGWLPTWEEPIHYTKAEGERALGCIRTTATNARGIDLVAIYRVFALHGERLPNGGLAFASKRKFEEALAAAGLAGSGRSSKTELAARIMKDHAADAASGAARYCPIITTSAGNGLRIVLKPESVAEMEADASVGGALQ